MKLSDKSLAMLSFTTALLMLTGAGYLLLTQGAAQIVLITTGIVASVMQFYFAFRLLGDGSADGD